MLSLINHRSSALFSQVGQSGLHSLQLLQFNNRSSLTFTDFRIPFFHSALSNSLVLNVQVIQASSHVVQHVLAVPALVFMGKLVGFRNSLSNVGLVILNNLGQSTVLFAKIVLLTFLSRSISDISIHLAFVDGSNSISVKSNQSCRQLLHHLSYVCLGVLFDSLVH